MGAAYDNRLLRHIELVRNRVSYTICVFCSKPYKVSRNYDDSLFGLLKHESTRVQRISHTSARSETPAGKFNPDRRGNIDSICRSTKWHYAPSGYTTCSGLPLSIDRYNVCVNAAT